MGQIHNGVIGLAVFVIGAIWFASVMTRSEPTPVNEHVAAAVKHCLDASGVPRYVATSDTVKFSCAPGVDDMKKLGEAGIDANITIE